LQHSKIRALGVVGDFEEIHVVDPAGPGPGSKREVFADILRRHGWGPAQVLVVGDDPESELKAAHELGIETVLYDHHGRQPAGQATYHIRHYADLGPLYATPNCA
jgi:putative hydrolase of the HAD superfamily